MQVIHAPDELQTGTQRVCLAIGFFDGVHLGHQHILRQTIADARRHEGTALVVTFDRHPNTVVAPGRVPALLYSLSQRLRTIGSIGADAVLLLHFDKALSQQTGERFVRGLAAGLPRIQSICVGANFVFGYKRGGNVELLKRLGTELGFTVHGVPALSLGGKPVSSTRIREAVANGDLDLASQMLGRPYSVSGAVVRGDGLGREIGFHTANLDTAGLALPPRGVYAVSASLDGKSWRAVLNIGYRPTLRNPNPQLRVEAHLIDFAGDLYGRELEVTFVARIRPERTFNSLAELRDQIGQDILKARALS